MSDYGVPAEVVVELRKTIAEKNARIAELEEQSAQKDAHIEVLWAGDAPQDAIEGVRKTAREEGRREALGELEQILSDDEGDPFDRAWGLVLQLRDTKPDKPAIDESEER